MSFKLRNCNHHDLHSKTVLLPAPLAGQQCLPVPVPWRHDDSSGANASRLRVFPPSQWLLRTRGGSGRGGARAGAAPALSEPPGPSRTSAGHAPLAALARSVSATHCQAAHVAAVAAAETCSEPQLPPTSLSSQPVWKRRRRNGRVWSTPSRACAPLSPSSVSSRQGCILPPSCLSPIFLTVLLVASCCISGTPASLHLSAVTKLYTPHSSLQDIKQILAWSSTFQTWPTWRR